MEAEQLRYLRDCVSARACWQIPHRANRIVQPCLLGNSPVISTTLSFPELHVHRIVELPEMVVSPEYVLVRPANDSDCTVTDCGSHVKRVLTGRFSLFYQRVFRI